MGVFWLNLGGGIEILAQNFGKIGNFAHKKTENFILKTLCKPNVFLKTQKGPKRGDKDLQWGGGVGTPPYFDDFGGFGWFWGVLRVLGGGGGGGGGTPPYFGDFGIFGKKWESAKVHKLHKFL